VNAIAWATRPIDEDGHKMGAKVKGWISRSAPKALSGGIKVGTAVGQALLTEFLTKYLLKY
jgi:hypothetical protein